MDKPQAYKVLGIEPGAHERDVRRAYRALLFDLEDHGQTDVEYPQKKKELEEAFAICLKASESVRDKGPAATAGSGKDAGGSTRRAGLFACIVLALILAGELAYFGLSAGTGNVIASAVLPGVLGFGLFMYLACTLDDVKQNLFFKLGSGVAGVLFLMVAFGLFRKFTDDWEGESPAQTFEMIVALESTGNDSKLVLFSPDGSRVDVPKYKPGEIDRDINWRADGSRVLFVSNREGRNFNVFRWNPANKSVTRRSVGGQAKGNLFFNGDDRPEMRDVGLMTSGGLVFTYNQKTGGTEQILPPPIRKAQGGSGDEEGTVGQIDAMYKKIGDAFVSAKWGRGRQSVWTVMRREGGEVFVYNPLTSDGPSKGLPVPVFAGKSISYDVAPSGDAIVSVRKFEFVDPADVPPSMMKDGKPMIPFDNVVFLVPSNGGQPVPMCRANGPAMYFGPIAKDEKPMAKMARGAFTFADPAVSPDGKMVALVIAAERGETGFEGQSVVLLPLVKGAMIDQPTPAVEGPVSAPAWGPNSDKLVLLWTLPDGRKAIYLADFKSRSTKQITDEGDFSSPKFSPQKG